MARRSPRNPLSDIVDAAGAWLGGNRGTINPQVERVTRDLGRAAAAADAVTGGFGAAAARDIQNFAQGGSLPTNLAKTAAVNLAAGAAGAKAAQVVGRTVSRVYKAAKETAIPSRMVLYHGGPAELKGGIIDPSFVQGNTAALNRQQLENVPQRLAQLRQNAKFSEDQLKIPGSYSAQNPAKTQKDIEKLRRSADALENWANRAKQENYFTAVGSADETYTHTGSVHVVSPRRKDVQTGLGPSGEYQVTGAQKPVASFPTGGRPGEQTDAAIRLAQAKGAALQKKLQRQAAIKQTAKNLIPKRK
jgi:hypothetical protein